MSSAAPWRLGFAVLWTATLAACASGRESTRSDAVAGRPASGGDAGAAGASAEATAPATADAQASERSVALPASLELSVPALSAAPRPVVRLIVGLAAAACPRPAASVPVLDQQAGASSPGPSSPGPSSPGAQSPGPQSPGPVDSGSSSTDPSSLGTPVSSVSASPGGEQSAISLTDGSVGVTVLPDGSRRWSFPYEPGGLLTLDSVPTGAHCLTVAALGAGGEVLELGQATANVLPGGVTKASVALAVAPGHW